MAIAFDTVTNGGEVTATSLTFSHTCTGTNRFLVVDVVGDVTNDTITGVTYAGAAMTLSGKSLVPGNRYHYFWYKLAPASGANNVVVSSSSSVLISARSASYTGCNQSAVDSNATATTQTNSQLHSVTTTVVADSWLIGSASENQGNVPIAGIGTTLRNPGGIRGEFQLADSNGEVAAGSRSLQWDGGLATTDWAGAMISINPFATAVIPSSTLLTMGVG